jgi:hypothetical protein
VNFGLSFLFTHLNERLTLLFQPIFAAERCDERRVLSYASPPRKGLNVRDWAKNLHGFSLADTLGAGQEQSSIKKGRTPHEMQPLL